MTRNTSTIASNSVTMTFSIEIFTNGAVSNGTEYDPGRHVVRQFGHARTHGGRRLHGIGMATA